jgi:hypothetical protein
MTIKTLAALAAGAALAMAGGAASAGELVFGVLAHDTGEAQREQGTTDLQFAYRTDRIQSLTWLFKPSVHVMAQVNTDVDTDFIAAGFNWPIALGDRFYVRPGIGLAYTTGKAGLPPVNAPGLSPTEVQRRLNLYLTRKDFGSKELFEPELSIGYNLSPKWAVEANYTHYSNGQIFHHGTNQGLDSIGARLVYRFGRR